MSYTPPLMKPSDRRTAERIGFDPSLRGRIDHQEVSVVDAGLISAGAEHAAPLRLGSRVRLDFTWEEEPLSFHCVVARTELRSRGTYRSGLQFAEAVGESDVIMKRLVSDYVTEQIKELKANARGKGQDWFDHVPFLRDGSSRQLSSHTEFLRCSLEQGKWKREIVAAPDQPPCGFTVLASESEEEVGSLCQAFETGDEASRRLIRVCAETTTR